ncbi:MAG: hypothetical protein L0241_05355 [Planctomycetia bacterium]|nr:hypothetical protein [Planctomycetia bacterium]
MHRFLLTMVAGLLFASIAFADVPPPPPPKGKKYVSVSHEVVLGKDVTGYVFVRQTATGPGRPKLSYEKVQFTPGKAAPVPTGNRRTYVTLFAVPQDTAKEFKADADLFAALETNKVKGVHRIGFGGTATVSDTVKGDSVKWTHTITAIDKDGIKRKVEGEGANEPKKGKNSPEEESPLASAPRGGLWVAGLACFAAMTLGGLWIAGRGKRKV